jgi:glycosyltransferase involved in cell wall biosynthesis
LKSDTLIVHDTDLVDYTHLLKKYRHYLDTVQLKILHLSDASLPDWRIEKSAISALNVGHEVVFAGRNSKSYQTKTFSKIYEIEWSFKAKIGIPFYWHSVKKQVEKVMREVRPDIVHAHDLFPAKMISEFGVPFVYDDHEYWSKLARLLTEIVRSSAISLPKKVKRMILSYYAIYLWTKWEKELVSCCPTITVSDKIAEELKTMGNSDRVFVVPNFPMEHEVKKFEQPRYHTKLSSVYAGSDGLNEQKYPSRNIDELDDTFLTREIGDLIIIGWEGKSSSKVKHYGFLPRQDMFEEMSKHSIGLIPFKKHWAHSFMSPNKAYEYAFAGLFVMCTSSIKPVAQTLGRNCITFEDYIDMASQLQYFKDNLEELYKNRVRIFDFARNNLTWEKYERNIFNAYQLC